MIQPSLVLLSFILLGGVQAEVQEISTETQRLEEALESLTLLPDQGDAIIADAVGSVDAFSQLESLGFSLAEATEPTARRRRRRATGKSASGTTRRRRDAGAGKSASGTSRRRRRGQSSSDSGSANRRRTRRRRTSPTTATPPSTPGRTPAKPAPPRPTGGKNPGRKPPTLMPPAPMAVKLCKRKFAWDKCNTCANVMDDKCYKFCLPTEAKPPPASPYTGQLHCETPARQIMACMARGGNGKGGSLKAGDPCVWMPRPGSAGLGKLTPRYEGRCQASKFRGKNINTCVKAEMTAAEKACVGKKFRHICHGPKFGYCVQGPAKWKYRLFCEEAQKPDVKPKGEAECKGKEVKDCCKIDEKLGFCSKAFYPREKILKVVCQMFRPTDRPFCKKPETPASSPPSPPAQEDSSNKKPASSPPAPAIKPPAPKTPAPSRPGRGGGSGARKRPAPRPPQRSKPALPRPAPGRGGKGAGAPPAPGRGAAPPRPAPGQGGSGRGGKR